MAVDLKRRTEFFIKDLHARESMRLGWYRQWGINKERMQYLRERKAKHAAFLNDLLRRRGLRPAWYARLFYISGNIFGFFSAFFPERWVARIERTLEFWILMRYREYFQKMNLDQNLRSMIESLQLKRLSHDEPAPDVINLIEEIIVEEEQASQPAE
ncbi:MAG: demethoxyubiquinone hydroxylase family protein [Bacteroidota bacterium]